MKNFTKQNFKTNPLWIRLLIMTFMVLLSTGSAWAVTIASGTKLYLTPNANWKEANARFAAYFFGDGEAWASMTLVETNVYEVTTPFPNDGTTKNYTNVIFCRMNPSATANNWNNKWNQTSDLTVPTNGNNHYTVKEGTWDKGGGSWSCYDNVTVYNVKGAGTTVELSNSEKWVTYTLYNGDNKVNDSDKKGNDNGSALSWTVSESGTYKVKATNGGCTTKDMSGSYTYDPYTYPSVSTVSAEVDGDYLKCKGKITSMGSATTVVWAFTVLSNENISKADADWKYPNNENQITIANSEFSYDIPISSLSLTNGNTYYVRAMTVDLNKHGYSSGQYENAVAGDAISFVYNPCEQLPDNAYSLDLLLSNWTDSDIKPTINKADNNYPTPTVTYNGSSTLPKNVGDYTVVATVTNDATYCDKTFNLGTFTITCPAPAEVPTYSATSATTLCKGTDNEIGVITLTNYDSQYSYQVNGVTVEIIDSKITGLAAGDYTVSAIKTCGSAQSAPATGTSVTITSRDLTPTIARTIEIFGDNSICAGETTVLTCNVETLGTSTIDTYSWNQEGTTDGNTLTTKSLNRNTSYVATVTITNEGCSKDFSNEQAYQVTVNPVPSFTTEPSNVTLCSNATAISVANLINESGAIADNSATIKLYAENEVEITEPIDINVNTQTTTTYKLKASTQACSSEFKTFTLTVNPIPSAPALTSPAPICEGGTINLPTEGLKWYNASTGGNVVSNTAITTTGTYWVAAIQNGCESATRTRYDVTVNPLPTVSIEKTEPATIYKYADVKLKASGNDISTVVWTADKGTITKQPNYPDDSKRAMLTYDHAGTVNVTATATSEFGCIATSSEFQVEFTEEDCSDKTTTVEQTVGKIKLLLSKPSWIGSSEKFYCYAWENNTSNTLLGSWPGTELTVKEGNYYVVIVDAKSKNIKIILNDNSEQTVDSDVLNANNIYQISATSTKSDGKYTFTSNTFVSKGTYKESVETIVQPTKSNPTVKTVSVTSNEDGVVTLNGMVVATGCNDQAKLGLQYKKQNQDGSWPDAYTTVEPNTKVEISKGKTFTTTTTLEDGTYKVRACAHADGDLKGYGYDVIITVSTVKIPITTVTLTHVKDQQGTPYTAQELQNLTYCVGDEVWFKLEQDGSDFKEYKWVSYPGTGLKGMYSGGTFKFTITGSGFVAIKLRNDVNVDNEGNATWVESNELEFNTHPESISPTISFEETPICSNKTATLNLGALVVGQKYELYEQIENDGTYSEERVGNTTLTCNSVEDKLQFTGLNKSGKYFVKAYTESCPNNLAPSQTATLEVVDESSVNISITPSAANTTPWMPVKLTVSATDNYTITVPDGVEYSQKGDVVSVKIPLPAGATGGEGQYENVAFPQDAVTSYTITANLATTGGSDNPCASPASATITLVPYEEPCVTEHNN